MRILVLFILINSSISDVTKIAKVNRIKRQAEKAFNQGEYDAAISSFRTLTDSLGINEDPILLNLANAYFHQNDTTNAQQYYSRVLSSEDAQLRSLAYQQMGIINKQKNNLDKALSDFKSALKSNPSNEDARYNYELLKQMMEQQEQQQENEDKDIEPSEYAKQLKAQADKLAKQNLFEQAFSIMQKGLQEDETVAAYNTFITKLNDVVESKQ
jgi:tetratricopeptide (TPR) repeat protein